jgi:hypothetical protein
MWMAGEVLCPVARERETAASVSRFISERRAK